MADEDKKANGAATLEVALQKAVIANGEETKTLTFREPTGADLERAGSPILIDFNTDPPTERYDTKSMTQMMALLAAVPPSTIRQMSASDWEWAALQLKYRFFLPGRQM
jgi:Phage tail assembly chaperone proteins, E, or 41 or 14